MRANINVKNGKWRISSRDFFKSSCEHCTRIDMAFAAGVPEVVERVTPYIQNLSKVVRVQQGNEYERIVFDKLKAQLGDDFVELNWPTMDETLDLLRAGVPVVAQGCLESEMGGHIWSGYPDLLIREDFIYEDGALKQISEPKSEPKYVVWDVKASGKGKPNYWLQVATYSKVLQEHNLDSTDDLGLVVKYFKSERLSRQEALEKLTEAAATLFDRLAKATPATIDISFIETWHCEKDTHCIDKNFCSFPKHCKVSLEKERSLHWLYWSTKVAEMNAARIFTWDDLVANDDPQWEKLRKFARVAKIEADTGEPYYDLKPKEGWLPIPVPTADDLFFDVEWIDPVMEKDLLIFEFGFVEANEEFTTLDGFTRAAELDNFKEFVRIAKNKMDANPLARIYHFHNPERLRLQDLVKRYDILHEEVDLIISREVDLKEIASSMLIPGANEYGIKYLEKYYDADEKLNRKANGVADGADAMWLFYEAIQVDPSKAQENMDVIRAYNRDDCLSTKLLRDWLLTL